MTGIPHQCIRGADALRIASMKYDQACGEFPSGRLEGYGYWCGRYVSELSRNELAEAIRMLRRLTRETEAERLRQAQFMHAVEQARSRRQVAWTYWAQAAIVLLFLAQVAVIIGVLS